MYRHVSWTDLKAGDEVYEKGKHLGDAVYFYGPFMVTNPQQRRLVNRLGRSFLHYPDDLYLKMASTNVNTVL